MAESDFEVIATTWRKLPCESSGTISFHSVRLRIAAREIDIALDRDRETEHQHHGDGVHELPHLPGKIER